jgi:hypothetical protein
MKQGLPVAAHRQDTATTHVLREKTPYLFSKNGGEIFARLMEPARGLTEPSLIRFQSRREVPTNGRKVAVQTLHGLALER